MTSDGSYPPGYEPADGGPPYGRYPGDEQDGRQQPPSGTARVTPGAWGPPPDAQYAPPTDRFAQSGADWPAQPGYPSTGPDQGAGRPAGYPTQPAYGIERPASANYASMGSDRPGQPGGWQPEPPAQGGWQPSDEGYSGSFGSASVPRPPEPARAPEQNWPADPSRPGGASTGRASVGGGSMGSAPVSPGDFGGPSSGGPTGRPSSGVYGTPTQYGSPGQFGGGPAAPGGGPGAPGQGGAPGVYGGGNQPGQYGSGQYGGAPAGNAGQFGGGQGSAPGQYGSGQFGGPATTQFGGATQVGTPGQYGGGPGQYGNQGGGQYGSGQYGGDPAIARFGPNSQDEPDPDGAPPRKSRRGLIIGLALAGVVIIALAAVAVVVSMSGGKSGDYAVGSCVKQSGDKAASVSCSDSAAYSIVTKTDSPTKCADQTQPYVVLQRSGSADEVLCLKPAH
jgi:hypothetical protein